MTDSQKLLAEYVQAGSEAAFREIVARYVNLVHSTALRLVGGDIQLAEDVTQTVFIHLARNARKLSRDSMLGGWLHRDTCYVASKTMRSERRRQIREREAALMNSNHPSDNVENLSLLDQAINLLGNDDRTAILLRFFEQRDFRSVGLAMGTSEDAARMRVTRALDKLQSILKRRGATISAAALATTLAAQAVSAAPAGLAGNVAGIALASSTAAAGASTTLFNLMTITKLKAGIAIVAAAVATPLAFQQYAKVKLREENLALRQQPGQSAQLAAENQRLSNLLAQSVAADDRTSELLRLRGEVAMLRKLTNELAALREDNRRLRGSLAKMPGTEAEGLERAYPTERGRVAKILTMPLILYARANGEQFPANFEDASRYFGKAFSLDPFMRDTAEFAELTADFEIVYHGSSDRLKEAAAQRGLDMGSMALIRERQPWRAPDGKLVRSYGLADGSGQLVAAGDDGTFEAWEDRFTLPAR
jgi:RNA polymerase sigma factor (sigma-70 family)